MRLTHGNVLHLRYLPKVHDLSNFLLVTAAVYKFEIHYYRLLFIYFLVTSITAAANSESPLYHKFVGKRLS